jgi:hypothetical protein
MAAKGGPLDHWHVDDVWNDWVAKASISLNVRGAVEGWSVEALGCYAEDLRTGGDYRLPTNIETLQRDVEYPYDDFPSDICDCSFVRAVGRW